MDQSAHQRRTNRRKAADLAKLEGAIAAGVSISRAVVEYASACGVSHRQGWKDYRTVRRRWSEQAAEKGLGMYHLGMALLRRDQIYRAAMLNGDLDLALKVEQDTCKLLDLYGSDRNDRNDRTARRSRG